VVDRDYRLRQFLNVFLNCPVSLQGCCWGSALLHIADKILKNVRKSHIPIDRMSECPFHTVDFQRLSSATQLKDFQNCLKVYVKIIQVAVAGKFAATYYIFWNGL
jgi:hypothetical protein